MRALSAIAGVEEVRATQRHRMLRARVAMALYSEYGRVPKEEEIDHIHLLLTRVLSNAILRTHLLRTLQHQGRHIALFSSTSAPC